MRSRFCHIHVRLRLHPGRLLILCKLYAWQERATIKISLVCDLCLCNLSELWYGMPALALELKPYLLQASHQSAQCRLALCWISAGLTPTRCVRPVSQSHVSAAVSGSPVPPRKSTWVEASLFHTLSPWTQYSPISFDPTLRPLEVSGV